MPSSKRSAETSVESTVGSNELGDPVVGLVRSTPWPEVRGVVYGKRKAQMLKEKGMLLQLCLHRRDRGTD